MPPRNSTVWMAPTASAVHVLAHSLAPLLAQVTEVSHLCSLGISELRHSAMEQILAG